MEPDAAGAHLTPFERALGRYLLSLSYSGLTTLADLASVTVKHEPYYMNDSGTSWPEDTTVVYSLYGAVRKDGSRRPSARLRYVAASADSPVEFMRELLDTYSDGEASSIAPSTAPKEEDA